MRYFRVFCDCGFTGRYGSPHMADYALRRHSCERHRRLTAKATDREAREAAIDRTPKPCRHDRASHTHGTHACYVLDHCRCLPCTAANTAYESNRTRQQAYGRWERLVDAGPVRDHVQSLQAAGMGYKRIAAASGVSNGALTKLIWGTQARPPAKRVKSETAARLLAVTADLAPGAYVSGAMATRRVRALVALGWSQSKIAAALGISRSKFHLAEGTRTRVTAATDHAVRQLYEAWSMKLPPDDTSGDRIAATRARNYAQARDWLPPLALDENTLQPLSADHVDEEYVDQAAVERRMRGEKGIRLNPAERAEVVRRCFVAGWTNRKITEITGIRARNYARTRPAAWVA